MKKETIRKIKTVGGIVVGLGVGTVVKAASNKIAPSNQKTLEKVAFGVGSAVIAAMIGECAGNYVENEIDKVVDIVEVLEVNEESIDESLTEEA